MVGTPYPYPVYLRSGVEVLLPWSPTPQVALVGRQARVPHQEILAVFDNNRNNDCHPYSILNDRNVNTSESGRIMPHGRQGLSGESGDDWRPKWVGPGSRCHACRPINLIGSLHSNHPGVPVEMVNDRPPQWSKTPSSKRIWAPVSFLTPSPGSPGSAGRPHPTVSNPPPLA